MSGTVAFADHARRAFAALADAWARLWFQNRSTLPIEITRIGFGAALLLNYGAATPYLFDYWGESGWMPQSTLSYYVDDPWLQSLFYYLTSSWHLVVFHVLFLLSCLAFMLGWRTSWVKWIVLIREISYARR